MSTAAPLHTANGWQASRRDRKGASLTNSQVQLIPDGRRDCSRNLRAVARTAEASRPQGGKKKCSRSSADIEGIAGGWADVGYQIKAVKSLKQRQKTEGLDIGSWAPANSRESLPRRGSRS